MKKVFYLILLFTIMPCWLFAQRYNCKRFHNGVFTTKSQILGAITINRHGSVQTESTTKGVFTFEVKWLSDCTYTLKPTAETIAKYKFPANALLTVTITKPQKKSYFQITSSNTTAQKAGVDVVKISN